MNISYIYQASRNVTHVVNYRNHSNNFAETILINIMAWFTIFSIVFTVLFNGLILLVFVQHRVLRTTFSVYIANLAITEILLAAAAMPCNFLREIYGYWPHNVISCTLFLYASQTFTSAIRYSHILITANRLWAVTFPISYKLRHTKRLARSVVIVMWIVVHVLNLPVVIRGRRSEGTRLTDPDPHCSFDNSQQWTSVLVVQLLAFTVPEIFILVAYVFIAFALKKRRRPTNMSNKIIPAASTGASMTGRRDSTLPVNSLPLDVVVAKGRPNTYHSQGTSEQRAERRPGARGNGWRSKSHNQLLAYLVASMVICWTPNHVYYLMMQLMGFHDGVFFAVQYLALYANSWLNPILIYFADCQIHAEVNQLFRSRFPRLG